MRRYRDNKGRFIASKISEKIEKQTTRNPPRHSNSSKIRAGKILRGEISKETIEATSRGAKYEVTIHIESIIKQARREALMTPSEGGVGKETKVVV